MDTRAKIALHLSKFVFLGALVFYIGMPTMARSQETTGSPSAEPNYDTDQAVINEGINTGTTLTEWWLNLFMGEPGENSDPTYVETFGEQSEQPTEDVFQEEESVNEEEPSDNEETYSPGFTPPPSPPLKTRRYGVEIFPDPKADHSCEAETLRVDLTEQPFAFRKIFLETYPSFSYSLEVGSLPDGIDMVFSETKIHLLHTDSPLTETTIEISKQDGARKGDFSVPLIFIERGSEDSAFICQLNIVNR